jgi:citrate synthase
MPEATGTAQTATPPPTEPSVAEQTAAVQFAPPTAPTVDAPATATLTYDGKEIELKVIPATEGSSGIEISKLLTTLGVITLDPGFTNTGSTTSKVTYIDGDVGILRYRGYPIEQLAQSSTFLETSYLLIHGELPSAGELEAFTKRISRHTMLH